MTIGERRRRGQGDGGREPPPRKTPESAAELAADRARALALTPVSRETAARLDRFVALLLDWQRRINLIAPSTETKLWTRHVADSLQLLTLAPSARHWADLGSGGGFPGLAIACALTETKGAQVHLVESNAKKAAFLREAARVAAAPAVIHATRIEDFVDNAPEGIEVVTARALAPLVDLLATAYPLMQRGAWGLFPKGQAAASELTEAGKHWKIRASLEVSRTEPQARIIFLRGIEPKAPSVA
jgi:16S rRNA (guanine527-N7)-methyltransferase